MKPHSPWRWTQPCAATGVAAAAAAPCAQSLARKGRLNAPATPPDDRIHVRRPLNVLRDEEEKRRTVAGRTPQHTTHTTAMACYQS